MKKREDKQAWDDRHWTDKEVERMTQRKDWRISGKILQHCHQGRQHLKPIQQWREAGLPLEIVDIIDKIGYTEADAHSSAKPFRSACKIRDLWRGRDRL